MSSIHKIALIDTASRISQYWTPKLVGQVNETAIKLVKVKGEFCWHHHAEEDELFLVISGCLHMHFRNGMEILGPGELIIVPKGVEHCPMADEETLVLLVEPASTLNTGNVENELTHYRLETLE